MARKKNKRHSKSPKKPASPGGGGGAIPPGGGAPTIGETEKQALERKARESMERGAFRRALEGYRRLFKIDPDAYRDAVVGAGAGYFRECLQQSLPKPAEAVVKSLEGIAAPSRLAAMGVTLALATKADGEAVRLARAILGDAGADPADIRVAVDALIAIPPRERGEGALAEPALIDRALADAATGNFAAAANAMRGLPRQSPFAHWRIFFKALAAHAEGDGETAGKALAMLDGACGILARAWIAPDAESLATSVALHGETKLAENLPALLRVDARADHAAVFTRFFDYCRGFPSVDAGIAATLTDYVCARLAKADPSEHSVATLSRKSKSPHASPLAVYVCGRVVFDSMMAFDFVEERDARLIGNVIREGRAAFPAHADWAEAIILHEYALNLIGRLESPFNRGFELPLAVEWLSRASGVRPDWDKPAIARVTCLFLMGEEKENECDAALCALLKRFPDNLEVRLQAGTICIRRNRHAEGQAHFLAVLARDPLNEKACGGIVVASLAQCVNALERGETKEAKRAADVACEHSRDSQPLRLRPAAVALQCGIFFEMHREKAAAKTYFNRASENVPADVFLFQHFATLRTVATRAPKTRRVRRPPAKFLKTPNFASAGAMLEFLVAVVPALSEADLTDCEDSLADYLGATVARDPDWRAGVIPFVRKLLALNAPPMFLDALGDAAEALAPRDPITRILEIAADANPADLNALGKARARFAKEGFADAVNLCDEIRKNLEHSNPYDRRNTYGLPAEDEDFDDDLDDFAESDFAEDDEALDAAFGKQAPILNIEEIRKTMKALFGARGMGKAAAEPKRKSAAGKTSAPSSPPEKKPVAPTAAGDDGSQLDLPF